MTMEGNTQQFLNVQNAPLWVYLCNAAKKSFSSNDIVTLLKAQEEWNIKNEQAKVIFEKEKMMQKAIKWTEDFYAMKLNGFVDEAIESCKICIRQKTKLTYEFSRNFRQYISGAAIELLQKKIEDELKAKTPSYMDYVVSVSDTTVKLENRLPVYGFRIEIKFLF